MPCGIRRDWKRIFISDQQPRPGRTLLDLAGGTGDISFGWLARGGGPVVLSDINVEVVLIACDCALARGLARFLSGLAPAAQGVPLPDRAVDVVAIAFGLRNCTDKAAVLAEA